MVPMDEYTRKFHTYIDSFEDSMTTRLGEIHVPDLLGLRVEMTIVCSEF